MELRQPGGWQLTLPWGSLLAPVPPQAAQTTPKSGAKGRAAKATPKSAPKPKSTGGVDAAGLHWAVFRLTAGGSKAGLSGLQGCLYLQ